MNFNLNGKGKISQATAKPKNRKKTLRRILSYLLRHKAYFIFAVILTISSAILGLFGPKFSGEAIAALAGGEGNVNFQTVWHYTTLMLITYGISAILSLILNILMVFYSQTVVYEMRRELFGHIVNMPISYFDTSQAGDIISRMSYDIDTVNTSLSSDIVTIASSSISIVGSFIMMLTIEPLLVLIFAITVPLSMIFSRMMQKRLRKKYRLRSKTLGEMNGYAEEMITGMKTVKAYSNEKDIADRFEIFNENACEAGYRADSFAGWNGPGINFINNLSLSLISMFSTIMYMYSYRGMDIGKISSFVLYSRKFSGPINEIANIISDIESALAASERVFEVLDLPIEEDTPNSISMVDSKGEIQFSHVQFGYTKDKEIIHDLSFHVNSGGLIAIVGPTGAGKTTIINLLMRFYDVSSGTIYLDGQDISKIEKKSLRKLYSMVLQDTWLRKGTVYENLSYGNKDCTLEHVKEVCEKANISDFIESLPHGYQTILDEGGNNISKGQKQLLTIARAMLLESKMLILDEATSNVDTSTEMKIQEAMRYLMKNKTCFVIAHRLSTIRNADLILVLNNGDIVEQGNHEELMKQKGFYASLYNAQFE